MHRGHVHAAETVVATLGIPELRLVLSARPSHKEGTGASLVARWDMLQLACIDHPRLVADDREIRRPRPSFTVETLEAVRADRPGEALVWVIGSDAYALLPSWHRWREVLELANLVVLSRPGGFPELSEDMQAYTDAHRVKSLAGRRAGGILLLDALMQEISSADIRAAIAGGREVDHLLPEAVALYIRNNRLYGARR